MPKAIPAKFVVVSNKSYGKALKGAKIYYEGARPPALRKDGSITFGKHILQAIESQFGKRARWIITKNENSIKTQYKIVRIRTSLSLLGRMNSEGFARTRDIKVEIVQSFLSRLFPNEFKGGTAPPYVPGTLGKMITRKIIPRLSSEDKEALSDFLPDYVASESIGAVKQLQASAHIKTLRALAEDLEREMKRQHAESWWQSYVKTNILLMQQGYIKALDKLNVSIGDTKFPDFCLVTFDNFIDILEIKKPDTGLLKLDQGRNNYYWDSDMAKAIIQTENYIDQVTTKADALRSYLLDKKKIQIKAVRPRGIILAGNAKEFTVQKQRDDFRLLSQGIKSISIVTYDELLIRLSNYIGVLEEFSKPRPRAKE
jgi:Domain of unknown function (DUF4263)